MVLVLSYGQGIAELKSSAKLNAEHNTQHEDYQHGIDIKYNTHYIQSFLIQNLFCYRDGSALSQNKVKITFHCQKRLMNTFKIKNVYHSYLNVNQILDFIVLIVPCSKDEYNITALHNNNILICDIHKT